MSQRGWVGWVADNKVVSAGYGVCVAIIITAVIGLTVISPASKKSKSPIQILAGTTTTAGPEAGTTTPVGGSTLPGLPGATGAAPNGPGGSGPGLANVPGLGQIGRVPCSPQADHETGITDTSVTIGEIVSDVSVLPQQLKPNYYGLQAYLKLVNDAGGICGRKINLVYSNDQANPATHDYSSLIHKVFSFVANSSLQDSVDYQSDAPFNPTSTDNGEYVPDIGGLAYSYGRNQSPWFAGTVGSLSPSLAGGGSLQTMVNQAKAAGNPCRKAGVLYLEEPTGASQDQARLGGAALAAPWGGNFGANVKYYVTSLAEPEPVYQQTVAQMIADGVNCVFTYDDLGSDITFVRALNDQGVWPPTKCHLSGSCFGLVYVPFAAYDPKFIANGGDGALAVTSFLPHIPLNELSLPVMQSFLNALKAIPGATPSTFSMIGYLSGEMFAQALRSCGGAPTRTCVMGYARSLKNFDGGGLQGPITPFRTTRVDCHAGCGSVFPGHGVYDFKWIFTCYVMVRVQDRSGVRDFDRVLPAQGYQCDTLMVGRGSPA